MPKKEENNSTHKKEVDLLWVQKYLRDGVYPPGLNFTEKRMVRKRAERFCFWKDELYYLGTPTDQSLGKKSRKVLLTKRERWEKIEECHLDADGTHLGLERTAENITAQYHWNGIYKFIKQYIRQCQVCLERHPKLLGKSKSKTEEDSDASMGEDTDSGAEDKEDTSCSAQSVVDLRLLGPFSLGESSRQVLVGIDSMSHWIEAFVLDVVSSDTVRQTLLQLISRYGEIISLTQSVESDELSAVLGSALQSLEEQSATHIQLTTEASPHTDATLKKATTLIEEFIEKNPATWPEKLDLCLLPLRMSNQKRSTGVSLEKSSHQSNLSMEEEMNKAAEALMSVHQAQVTAQTLPSSSTPMIADIPISGRGIVTRSRTGRSKPKTLDEDNYEVPAAVKRRASVCTAETASPARKKVKVEIMSPESSVLDIVRGSVQSTVNTDQLTSPVPVKKTVELDEYYRAIKLYVTGGFYPKDSTASFKRLIRDQSRQYTWKDGALYHEVGPNRELKKIVMTKDERLELLSQAHKSANKGEMLQALDNYHWKGKVIDCEAFLLACDDSDNSKNIAEAKRQLMYDRLDTYQEISNYIVYDVFSDDNASKHLEYLQRQIKNFKIENDELVHYTGDRKQKVITSVAERQKLIAEVHQKKGSHADLTSTYHMLADEYFWFGMKFDVKIYITYCCTTENKHLLDRYFIFREYHMKQPLLKDVNVAESSGDVKPSVAAGIVTEDGNIATNAADVSQSPTEIQMSPSKPTGIFVSSMKYPVDRSQTNLEVSNTGQSKTELPVDVTEAGDGPQQIYLASDGTIIESGTELPTTIFVRVTEDGQTIILREDGSQQGTIQVEGGTEIVQTSRNSDDVTSAAVKSILQDPAVSNLIAATETGTVGHQPKSEGISQQTVVTVQELPDADTHTDEESGTADNGTNTDEIIEEGEDSDSWIYGTDDDDDDDDGMEEGQKSSILAMYMTADGEKRPTTPRQHFKCSQCNKIFYGPLKFKMHMYKHTGQKPFPCNLCHKKYTNKKSLVLHQKSHTGELPFLCTLCGKRCPSKISLKSHLRCHDGNGGGFPAKCEVCERVFTRKHLMERHKLHKHTNLQTEFKCSECNKVFSHQRSLKRHFMSSHLNIKNHVCGLCGKSFYRKEYLTGHLIQHGGAAAEGLTPRKQRPSTFKPRPSVFNTTVYGGRQGKDGDTEGEEYDEEQDSQNEDGVQRIILTQDENGQLRVVDMATEREVKRMLQARGLSRGEAGETMVVHIEEPSGEPQVVHVEHTEEQVVEVPIGEHGYIEYQQVEEDKPQEYIVGEADGVPVSGTQYIYTSPSGEVTKELVYGQPAVQYEVECVGDVEVEDEEALSAINLLAQASAQQYHQASANQYENVISQI